MARGAEALGGSRRGEFTLFLVLSSAGHVLLAALLAGDFLPSRPVVAPSVIAVDLVAAPRSAPRATPKAPAPTPLPPPAPAKPKPRVPKQVLLPKEPRRDASKPVEKAKAPPKPAPTPPVQRDYSDVMAQLRAEAGEEPPQPEPQQVAAVTPPAGARTSAGAPGAGVSPEVAAWIRRAKRAVRDVWVVPPGFRTQDLEAHVLVDLDAQGRVLGEPRIVRRSGNPWYDEGVVRAIQKASPLPPPPEPDRWSFVFVPEDSF